MPPVSLRTNFMDRKARDFFFYGAAYQSSRSCLVGHTKMSDALGQKTFLQLQEWQQPRNGHCETVRANRSARRGCATNYGREFRRTFQTPNKTARMRTGWQTH